ncbi:MAG: serine/threonine protein kinase [Deltaproteobacteria bacterium]|nr:MAG: serine/threonine protein kinase [Deltaproteobacteria bacterium]
MQLAHETCPHCGLDVTPEAMQGLVFCPRCHFPLILINDRFRLKRRLATGGFGIVYWADDLMTDDDAVVKVIKPEFFEKPSASIRFNREIRWTEILSAESPHIVRYLNHGSMDGLGHFYAMEYLRGITLEHRVLEPRDLPFVESFAIFRQLCDAVSVAHRHNVVHRDLKPDNVFLVREAGTDIFVKVLDFGIAKPLENTVHQSLTQGILGTPSYLSPEQCRNQDVDHRSDIYSLGVILYELLTREQLFPADKERMMEVVQQHLFKPPPLMRERRPDLGLPEELEGVVGKALEKDANHRYQSVEEFAVALEPFASLPGVATHPNTPLPKGLMFQASTNTSEDAYLATEDVVFESISGGSSREASSSPSVSRMRPRTGSLRKEDRYDTEEDGRTRGQRSARHTSGFNMEPPPKDSSSWLWMVAGVLAGLAGLLVWRAFQLPTHPVPPPSSNNQAGNTRQPPGRARALPPRNEPLAVNSSTDGGALPESLAPELEENGASAARPRPARKPARRARKRRLSRRRFVRRKPKRRRRRPPTRRRVVVPPKLRICGAVKPNTYWVRGINSHANPVNVKILGCSGCRVVRRGAGVCVQVPQHLKTITVRVKVEGFVTCHHRLGRKRQVVRWKLRVFDLNDVVEKDYPCYKTVR